VKALSIRGHALSPLIFHSLDPQAFPPRACEKEDPDCKAEPKNSRTDQ
jgi:hypothetical protein